MTINLHRRIRRLYSSIGNASYAAYCAYYAAYYIYVSASQSAQVYLITGNGFAYNAWSYGYQGYYNGFAPMSAGY